MPSQLTNKPYHEETLPERDARHQAEIAAASQPTPEQIRAQNLANEKAHQAFETFQMLEESGQDRYEDSSENRARLHAILGQLHGGQYSESNLLAALDYGIKNGIIRAKPAVAKTPQTDLEWADLYKISVKSLRATSKERIRALRADPSNDYLYRRMIDAVCARGY